MPYQISIRRITVEHGDVFAAARVCVLANTPFRLGTAPDCDFVLSESVPDGTEMTLRPDSTGTGWSLHPSTSLPPEAVMVNGLPAGPSAPLETGDEISIGNYTIRFEQLFENVRNARHTDLVAWAAKALVGCVIAGELLVVTWLPGWLHTTRLWDREVARQQTTMFLDKLRTQVGDFSPKDPVETGVRNGISAELDRLAEFLRTDQDSLSPEQWRDLRADLDDYESALNRLYTHTAVKPVPSLDIEGAVRAITGFPVPSQAPNASHDK